MIPANPSDDKTEQIDKTITQKDSQSGFTWWTQTLKYKTGLGLTEEEKTQYEKISIEKNKIESCKRCEEYLDFNLNYSPTVIFMIQQINKFGGFVPKDKIKCDYCEEAKMGGYNSKYGIQLCANYNKNKFVLGDTLSHELVHWFDNTRFKVDWNNLRHQACSEIRAASLSGECAIMTEFKRRYGFMRVSKGHQSCVKRKAVLSLLAHPDCKDKEMAEQAVDEVFRSCFNDTRPFEMIYR